MVRASFDHLGNMLSFLIDRHGPYDCTLGWVGKDLDLNGTCFGNLTVQLLQFCGVLKKREKSLVSSCHKTIQIYFMHL